MAIKVNSQEVISNSYGFTGSTLVLGEVTYSPLKGAAGSVLTMKSDGTTEFVEAAANLTAGDGINISNADVISVDIVSASTDTGLYFSSDKLDVQRASGGQFGIVKIGDGIDVNDGEISVVIPDAPVQSIEGGRAITTTGPDGNGKVTVDADIATASGLGVVSVGDGLSITAGGELSVNESEVTFPVTSVEGTAPITVSDSNGVFTVAANVATNANVGVVKPGAGLSVQADGTLDSDFAGTDTLQFIGAIDPTKENGGPDAVPSLGADEKGYVYIIEEAGTIDSTWADPVIAGKSEDDPVSAGDLLIWKGTEFCYVERASNDLNYVVKNGTANPQVITGTGGLKTQGLLESAGGVKVSGGQVDLTENSGEITFGVSPAGGSNSLTLKGGNGGNWFGLSEFGLRARGTNTRLGQAYGGVYATTAYSANNTAGTTFLERCDYSGVTDKSLNFNGFSARPNNLDFNEGDTGEYKAFNALTPERPGVFNFYAASASPNFFEGNTHIGGTTSRNTFELWKSTLTEEQLEQYEAGTYAVPANVSVPGDGSFARAWYYEQQDAETQALLDSGELEYPTHLAAATFTDTFALGDTTKINLLSSGGIQAKSIEFTGSGGAKRFNYRGIGFSGSDNTLDINNHPKNADENVIVIQSKAHLVDDEQDEVSAGNLISFRARNHTSGDRNLFTGATGLAIDNLARSSNSTQAGWSGDNNVYGIYSDIFDRTVDGKTGKNV